VDFEPSPNGILGHFLSRARQLPDAGSPSFPLGGNQAEQRSPAFGEELQREPQTAEAVAGYIWLNPVRKGLVAKPDDYPFVGSYTGKAMPAMWNALDWCPAWKETALP